MLKRNIIISNKKYRCSKCGGLNVETYQYGDERGIRCLTCKHTKIFAPLLQDIKSPINYTIKYKQYEDF